MVDALSGPISSESDSTCYRSFAGSEILAENLWKTRLAARLADELTPQIIARFHTKYDKSDVGCWLWKTGLYRNGYGMFYVSRVQGRQLNVQSHRVAYLLAGGELTDGLVVMHSCDTPACVNPAHLSLGTQADNVGDASRKGHYLRGLTVGSVRWKREQRGKAA